MYLGNIAMSNLTTFSFSEFYSIDDDFVELHNDSDEYTVIFRKGIVNRLLRSDTKIYVQINKDDYQYVVFFKKKILKLLDAIKNILYSYAYLLVD